MREQLDEVASPNVQTMAIDIRRVITLFFAALCFFDDDCLIPDVSPNGKLLPGETEKNAWGKRMESSQETIVSCRVERCTQRSTRFSQASLA